MTLDAQLRATVGALDLDVDLEIRDHEIVAVLGPNGAGKTTILRILAGLLRLGAGHVRLDDELLDDPDSGVFVVPERRSVGFVPQDYLLFPHLSVRENVAFGLRSRGVPRREARGRADEWLGRVGLAEYADQKPRNLSGGQAQRVALARTLAPSPRLLLLDEPLAALDASTRVAVRHELRTHLHEFGGIRLLVTHDPIDAATLADRLIVIEAGRISQAGSVADVTSHPRSSYVAELVGMNLYRGVARRGAVELARGSTLETGHPTLSGDVFLAVTPRAVALYREEPFGSPRNRWLGTVTDLVVVADRVRVRLEGAAPVVAEITTAAAAELGIAAGDRLWSVMKATDVDVYPV
jgi:molybdate transport system ATP-binding protein